MSKQSTNERKIDNQLTQETRKTVDGLYRKIVNK